MVQVNEHCYINIHSHRKPMLADEFVIRNAYLEGKPEVLSNLPYKVSVGLHPWFVRKYPVHVCTDMLIERVTLKSVLAVGEIGIDRSIDIPLQEQLKYFEAQLNVARAVQKPVVLHAVRSYSDFVVNLKKAKVSFIFHGFNGNIQQANELIKHGAILSFGKGLWHDKQAEVFQNLPDGTFLLETDNAPIFINDVYAKAAAIRNSDVNSMKSMLFHTFAQL